MQRSTQRENIRIIREEIQQATEQRTCCPLSFCQSTEHKCIQDCDHPDRFSFVGQFHTAMSRQCYDAAHLGTFDLNDIIVDLKNRYLTEEHITDEQIDILLVRLSISPWTTWRKSRNEKIDAIMKRYAKLIEDYYYVRWDEPDSEMMDHIDILALDLMEDYIDEHIKPEIEPIKIKLILKENENSIHGYLTQPDQTNILLECPICYEPECFITTNCRHVFCECITKHIATTINQQTTPCCPCCREPISVLEFSHKKHFKIISTLTELYLDSSPYTIGES